MIKTFRICSFQLNAFRFLKCGWKDLLNTKRKKIDPTQYQKINLTLACHVSSCIIILFQNLLPIIISFIDFKSQLYICFKNLWPTLCYLRMLLQQHFSGSFPINGLTLWIAVLWQMLCTNNSKTRFVIWERG